MKSTPHIVENETGAFWWTRNFWAVLYFMRELTGVGIALYMTVFVILFVLDPSGMFIKNGWFYWVSWVGFVSAIFHSLTWLGVTMKITPFDLPKRLQRLGFIALLVLWGAVSYGLMNYFYEGASYYIFYGL